MLEVFTYGGGTYLVTVFNAVASLRGSSAMANLISAMAALSLMWVLLRTAFGASWNENIKWFVVFLTVYMVLFVPRVSVQVTDKLNPGLANSIVANVPYGLAFFASTTSEVGEGLTRLMETTFSLPDEIQYQETGMIFGARIVEESSRWRITDSIFSGNMTRMARQCVFMGVLLGHIDLNDLKRSDDLWEFIEDNASSPLRSFDYRTATGRSIETCEDGIKALSLLWTAELANAGTIFGQRLFPGLGASQAKTELLSRLPVAHEYLIGLSRNAADIMRQEMVINALDDGVRDWASTVGNTAALQSYTQARADLQTRAVYKTTGLQAEKWVPLLRIVFECLYYGAFPIAFLMMLTPMGLTVFKGYFSGFLWLQSWGPLYAILHFIIMGEIAEETTAVMGGQDVALVSQLGMRSIIQETSAMAGYLSMSIPFIAFGLMFGAQRFAGLATSMLAPTQRAAGTAAEEATSGNISLGNTSFDNHSFTTMRGHQMSTSANMDHGNVTKVMGDGSSVFTGSGGINTVQKGQAISDPGWTANVGSAIRQGLNQSITDGQSLAMTQGNRVTETNSAANNEALDYASSVSESTAFNTADGMNYQNSISEANRNIRSAAEKLSESTNLNMDQSLKVMGGVGTGNKIPFGSLGGNYGASGLTREQWSKAQDIAESYEVSNSFDTIRTASSNHSFSEGQSALRDQRDSMSASFNEASSAEQSYNEALSRVQSYEQARSRYEENSGSFNANVTQRAMEIGAQEYGGDMHAAFRASNAESHLAERWTGQAVNEFLDTSVPINTLSLPQNNITGTSSSLDAIPERSLTPKEIEVRDLPPPLSSHTEQNKNEIRNTYADNREKVGRNSPPTSMRELRQNQADLGLQQALHREEFNDGQAAAAANAQGNPGDKERIAEKADQNVLEGAADEIRKHF